MEVVMQVDTNRKKDLTEGQKKGRRSWCGVAMISIIVMALTACATPVSPYDLKKEGRYKEAVGIWEPMAEKGDYRAQFALFSTYSSEESRHHGYEDQEKATYWLVKAAVNHNPTKRDKGYYMELLAYRYEKGTGTSQDFLKACYWYNEAYKDGRGLMSRSEIASKVEECIKAGLLPR